MKKVPFIVFEGIDGCGKTSVVQAIGKAFPRIHLTREPGGTPIAEDIRKLLLSEKGALLTPYEQMTLFFAARSNHLDRLIEPKRQAGVPVVSDRFDSSTFTFQKCMRRDRTFDVDLFVRFQQLRDEVVLGRDPTLYVYLLVDPRVGMRRRALASDQELNHFDLASLEEQERRHMSYAYILKSIETSGNSSVCTVDANKKKKRWLPSAWRLSANSSKVNSWFFGRTARE